MTQETKKGAENPQRRLHSPPRALAIATASSVGGISAVFAGANHNLSSSHYVVALMLAIAALLLIVEAFYREQDGVRWISIGGIGVLLAAASLTFVALPTDHRSAVASGGLQPVDRGSTGVSGNGGLELSLWPIQPKLLHLAFYKQIPLPKPNEGWSQLRRRGGVDVGYTKFRMTLANRSNEPISVLSVKIEVLGSKPRPRGTFAYHFSQGEEGIGQLTAFIDQVHSNATARVYKSSGDVFDPAKRKKISPYFQTTYILLQPGEIYPASLAVHAESNRLVRFRFVAEGRSAGQSFVQRSSAYTLVGTTGTPSDERYARTYTLGQYRGLCTTTPKSPWYDARYVYSITDGAPCPSGADAPQEIPLKEPGHYPPGRFRLDLGVRPNAQQVTIDGITVGRSPAAQPVPSLALPLIRALGAWSLCIDRWPVPGYWTASWERWGLNLVFAGEAPTNCTPQSASDIREIELWGHKQMIHTDDGLVTVGVEPAKVPAAIRSDATVEANQASSEVVLQGTSSCDPGGLVNRAQTVPERPEGGILALHVTKLDWVNPRGEERESSEIERAVSTLPVEEC